MKIMASISSEPTKDLSTGRQATTLTGTYLMKDAVKTAKAMQFIFLM
jgi:hypothetical protein